LNLVETLRAAAPWQRLRRRPDGSRAPGNVGTVVEVRKEDFRVTRFQKRSETTVIFAVDASGSAALQRLAEAKGAVEQVLADCYARRDHVALVAFRGTTATLLLPPTRSLARVRRRLADLAGGGTTPLAAGIDAALTLALEARKQDKLPLVVLMTDGRANVARSGNERSAAGEDALASGRAMRAAGVRALLLDTAPRPRPEARLLATAMDARYLPLPYLDAAGISRQVRALASEAR
jgi:magnesium chelatase subunit D